MKIIAIKELFINNCKTLYLNLDMQLHNNIEKEINAISAAKTTAQQISQAEIKLKLKVYIN